MRVQLETDDDLALGEFGIAARMVQPRRGHREEPEPRAAPAATMIYTPSEEPEDEPGEAEPEGEPMVAVLSWDGHTHRVESPRAVLGRSRECDVQIEDVNVSRRHAELRRESDGFWIVDLDSTNGVEVDGRRVKRAKLDPGATFTVGSTAVTFATEPA